MADTTQILRKYFRRWHQHHKGIALAFAEMPGCRYLDDLYFGMVEIYRANFCGNFYLDHSAELVCRAIIGEALEVHEMEFGYSDRQLKGLDVPEGPYDDSVIYFRHRRPVAILTGMPTSKLMAEVVHRRDLGVWISPKNEHVHWNLDKTMLLIGRRDLPDPELGFRRLTIEDVEAAA